MNDGLVFSPAVHKDEDVPRTAAVWILIIHFIDTLSEGRPFEVRVLPIARFDAIPALGLPRNMF